MAQRQNNFYKINAPAGSGKTYFISKTINDILNKNPFVSILCITYTNRASEVMRERIISLNVEISTIHSFLNNFLKPFFRNEKVIDYYLEIYKEEIEVILKGETKLIERYKERFQIEGEVSEETVKSNLDEIYYNERQNSFVLDGGLSHDDLLNFSFKLIERFPKIGFKLREMYNYIFIDEVQDTSADILRFFYNSAKGSSTKVYFLGDKMQEIYNKYDGSFEDEYAEFDDTISQKFPKNYRSSKEIVDLLNNLYLSSYKVEQDSDKGEKGQLPQIVFTDNIENYLSDNSEVYEEFYKLRTVNIKRFENIDNSGKSADDIYKKYQKLYPNNGRISVMDVLVNSNYDENPDELMSFLSLLFQVLNEYNNKNYGEVIRILRSVRKSLPYGKSISVFDRSLLKIELHEDKIKLKEKLDFFVKVLESSDLLGTVLQKLVENKIISSDFYNFIFLYEKNGEFLYTDLFCYSVELFKLIDEYNRNPMVSTQHGVKGEEHKKILFVSENSNTPGIKIYEFLNLFTSFYAQNIAFNFDDFQAFYYNFNRDVLLLEEKIGQKLRNIKVSDRKQYFSDFQTIYNKYLDNEYFKFICLKENTLSFQEKTATKDMKIIFNNNLVRSTLTAYKLFYVGCSRAEEELVVLIDENQIENMQEFKSCFKQIGFQINC
ncbi:MULTISPECIES: UvrD-helicase domain-containing protein [Streptococcus]|uniref:UvrD-helicase domain-containing protein n=1 Tax=Streptococcus TaxID=1301 RepID=UPI00066D683F|nr:MULTISPECIES: UvrD-helicase domain-containing protein [Streptococcus]MCW0997492.1 AAA family ATPase [Streptococcus anginosus]